MNTEKTAERVAYEAKLKTCKLRGGFELASDIEIEEDLMGNPATLKAQVNVSVDSQRTPSKLAGGVSPLELIWNIQGRCVSHPHYMLDLVVSTKK